MGKQDNITDGSRIGKQHHQPIDANALASRRRHTVLEGSKVILVHPMGFLVPMLAGLDLLEKTLALVTRIVEFGKGIGHFAPRDEQFKAIGDVRIVLRPPRQGRDFDRIMSDESGLDQFGFHVAGQTAW